MSEKQKRQPEQLKALLPYLLRAAEAEQEQRPFATRDYAIVVIAELLLDLIERMNECEGD